MKAIGLFFLTKRIVQTTLNSPTDGPVRGWQFDLVWRLDDDGAESRAIAFWRGAEADQMAVQNWEALKSGCALTLELERVRLFNDVLRGRIVSCALAPVRWPGRTRTAATAIASAMKAVAPRTTNPVRPSAA